MDYPDHYATLGLKRTADQGEIKRAYRKLARQYHPDLSKEPHAEARFKEIALAHKVLVHPEQRAAYDEEGLQRAEAAKAPRWAQGAPFEGDTDGQAHGLDDSEFFNSMFARAGRGDHTQRSRYSPGSDQQARVVMDLKDSYVEQHRTITLGGRELQVSIPKGMREGQHLRLAGQGGPGHGGAPSGDLYLEIVWRPHHLFTVQGRDVYVDLPLAPWEAALGATVTAPTPEGQVQLTIPPGSLAGRKLRLKGKGLPSVPPGDLYAVLGIAVPPITNPEGQAAFAALARAFPHYDPRQAMNA